MVAYDNLVQDFKNELSLTPFPFQHQKNVLEAAQNQRSDEKYRHNDSQDEDSSEFEHELQENDDYHKYIGPIPFFCSYPGT